MKTIEFNIGIHNNPYTMEEIVEQIAEHPITDKFEFGRLVEGTWHDGIEPTAYLRVKTGLKRVSTVIAWVENLCTMMDQTAIAITIDGVGYLVYNFTDSEEERVPFDGKYFVRS